MLDHIKQCKEELKDLEEEVDYVVCKLCNQHCQRLAAHIRMFHAISPDEYKQLFGALICSNSSQKATYANLCREESWQSIAIKNGANLSDYYEKCGIRISKSIMSNMEERERRSIQMKKLYEDGKLGTDEMRAIFSEIAKETSSRPEIIQMRSDNLQKWRAEHPEEFKRKCTDQMLAAKPKKPTWFSKPEKMLFDIVSKIDSTKFKFNQVVKSDSFYWKSKRKQIDMADKANGIYIEFDGPFHFELWNNENALLETHTRDLLLNKYMIDSGYLIIRISYDQFHDKKKNGGYFNDDCIKQLIDIINDRIQNNISGIFKIGEKYGQYSKY